MKLLFIILTIVLFCGVVCAQTDGVDRTASLDASTQPKIEPPAATVPSRPNEDQAASPTAVEAEETEAIPVMADSFERDADLKHFAPVKTGIPATADTFTAFTPLVDDKDFTPPPLDKFHWKPALVQSFIFVAIQHGSRLIGQPKTRRALKGPFFKDWGRSVKGLQGWDDGGLWFTNYIAHPLQGGLTGRIFVNNSDRAQREEFGSSKGYWNSRFKAFVWSALWGAQFEIGPISEASIGNVGMTLNKKGKTGMAWVDIVVTPVLGTGVLIGEDAIDKYVLTNWIEKNTKSRTMIKFWRTLLMPTTSFANILRGEVPWKRDRRPY